MTVEQFIQLSEQYSLIIAIALAIPIVITMLLGMLCPGHRRIFAPCNYMYSILTYWVAIPGMFAFVITTYSLFFTHQNLLQVNFFIYHLPIITMFVTFVLIGKQVSFSALPGFGRLWGLMVLIGVTFVILLFIYKTRIFIGFFSNMTSLLIFGLVLYILLWLATKKLFK